MLEYPESWKQLKVALAHDWLTGMRGGERVLELLCQGFPQASLYTLLYRPEGVSALINAHPVHPSCMQRIPRIERYYPYFLPFYPSIIERFQPEPADLLISTHHCVAKGFPKPEGAFHCCYCFTPMRYAWTFYDEYFGHNKIKKALLTPMLRRLRQQDKAHARNVDHFIAISQHVRQRILRFYEREADVVYPPVDTDRCTPGPPGHDGYDLIVSALVPYKRVDLAVRAYTRSGEPLVIVGTGTEYNALRAMAGANIRFTGRQTDDEVLHWYRRCRQLIFPGEEDFGIVPLEAQACGKPVVAYGVGGATETIVNGVTGIFFREPTVKSLLDAVAICTDRPWDTQAIRENALRFHPQHFIDGIADSMRTAQKKGTAAI